MCALWGNLIDPTARCPYACTYTGGRDDSKRTVRGPGPTGQVPLSDFVRSAAEARADEVLREHDATTRVPAAFFDQLLAALDAPAVANPALAAAGRRAQTVITRD
jgi:hypothetical protein